MITHRTALMLLLCTAFAAHAQVRISELPEATNAAGAQFVIIQSGATKRIAEGVVRTVPAANVTGLGPFAIATNLTSTNISDFSNAVVAVAAPTTNASLLTAGTLADARLSTNVARVSQLAATNIAGLGPFATATNLLLANVDGLQAALDGKLATNGTLPAANVTGLGPFAIATNLASTNISDFSNSVVAVAPPTTNASLLTAGTLEDARISTNIARVSQLAATNIAGLGPFATATNLLVANVDGLQAALDGKLATNGTLPAANVTGLGPFATATNISSSNITDFSNAVTAVSPPVAWSNLTGKPSAFAPEAHAATHSVGGTDQLAATNIPGFSNAVVAVAPPTTNASLLTTGTLDNARLSSNVVVLVNDTATASAWLTDINTAITALETGDHGMGWDELGRFTIATPVGSLQMYATGNPSVPTFYWPGRIVSQYFDAIYVNGAVSAAQITGGAGEVIAQQVMTASMPDILSHWQETGAVNAGIPSTVETNGDTEITEAVPGTYYPATSVSNVLEAANTMQGVYLTAQTLVAGLGITATNVSGLGPFATATNLAITNIDGLQSTLDGKLATNGTLAASNVTGLGPFATATNLTSTNISDFSNAVTAIVGTNGGGTNAIAWATPPAATNSAGTPGQLAYTNNYFFVCVGTNTWRRVLLGTW